MKRLICTAAGAAIMLGISGNPGDNVPQGWLLWHRYTSYEAMDSELLLRTPDGIVTPITGDFVHPMNGSFGASPADIVFMAIDPAADEWDIFRYNAATGKTVNLTENSGFRNEDPKPSPDGSRVLFKRGHWDHSVGDFRYDLAELSLSDGTVTMLTDDPMEEAMPCYAPDGTIFYAGYTDGISAIYRLFPESGSSETVWSEPGVTAYYPMTCGDVLCFTRWRDSESRCDQIVRFDGEFRTLDLASPEVNCSDPCPVGDGLFYSSTEPGNYDLYWWDGNAAYPVNVVNSEKNDLGAAFYPMDRYEGYLSELSRFLLGDSAPEQHYDVDGDGAVDVYDLAHARALIK